MAYIFKDGKYYNSDNGQLTEINENTVSKSGIPLLTPLSGSNKVYGTGTPSNVISYDDFAKSSQSSASGIPLSTYDSTQKTNPVTGSQQTTVQPTTQETTQTTPAQSYNYDYSVLYDLLSNLGQTAQGTQEDYNSATSFSEIMQALQDNSLQDLNRPYGYTDEEKAVIWQNALNDFNKTQDDDLQMLQNLYEAYGLNSGAGELGGQAGSSLQDYYGERSDALASLTGDIAQQFIDQYNTDRQNAIANAQNVANMVYNQERGNFEDYMTGLNFSLAQDAQTFDQILQAAEFYSEDMQRQAMIDLGYSQLEIDTYFNTLNTQYQQTYDYASLLSSLEGLSASDVLSSLTSAYGDEASVLSALGGNEEDSALLTAIALALMGNSGDGTGESSLLSDIWNWMKGSGGDSGNSSGMSWDWLKQLSPDINWDNPLEWPSWALPSIGSILGESLNAGASFTFNGKTYSIGDKGIPELPGGSEDGEGIINLTDDAAKNAQEAANWIQDMIAKGGLTAAAAAAEYGAYRLVKESGGTETQAQVSAAMLGTPLGTTITTALAGYNYIKGMFDGDETKGGHGRRLAEEYVGTGKGPIAWMNWQILEADGNTSKDHHRSGAIETVDKIIKAAVDANLSVEEAMLFVDANVNSILTEKYKDASGWSPELIQKYRDAAHDALLGVADNNEDILTF